MTRKIYTRDEVEKYLKDTVEKTMPGLVDICNKIKKEGNTDMAVPTEEFVPDNTYDDYAKLGMFTKYVALQKINLHLIVLDHPGKF